MPNSFALKQSSHPVKRKSFAKASEIHLLFQIDLTFCAIYPDRKREAFHRLLQQMLLFLDFWSKGITGIIAEPLKVIFDGDVKSAIGLPVQRKRLFKQEEKFC